jgi:dephospho-CoA kinase
MTVGRPLVVGLTGSIGMGKTETAGMFARLGIPVHDADAAVHRLYEPGGAAVPAIAEAFPDCVQRGRVDRVRLASRVRGDKATFARLEAIVHPLVAEEQRAFIERAAERGADVVVLDVPLLFESGSHAHMDAVVVVSAPAEVQRARVLRRPGMSEEQLDQILERQMPDVDKRARAHFVVETDKGLRHACEQVESIVSALRGRRKQDGNA